MPLMPAEVFNASTFKGGVPCICVHLQDGFLFIEKHIFFVSSLQHGKQFYSTFIERYADSFSALRLVRMNPCYAAL